MKIILPLLISLVLIGGLIYLFHEKILQAIGDFLVIQNPPQRADVIHVVSGPDYRTFYAIQLYQQGYARNLFYTGGWCAEIQGAHANRSRDQSIEQGIPSSVISLDSYQVTSTFQEAERLKLWIEQAPTPIHSVIVVSDPHHMRRAQWTYRKILGKDVKIIMAPVPFEQTHTIATGGPTQPRAGWFAMNILRWSTISPDTSSVRGR